MGDTKLAEDILFKEGNTVCLVEFDNALYSRSNRRDKFSIFDVIWGCSWALHAGDGVDVLVLGGGGLACVYQRFCYPRAPQRQERRNVREPVWRSLADVPEVPGWVFILHFPPSQSRNSVISTLRTLEGYDVRVRRLGPA